MTTVAERLDHAPKQDAGRAGQARGKASAAMVDSPAHWRATPLAERLRVLRGARERMSARGEEFAAAISPKLARSKADTLVTELSPLLDACKFLEKEAGQLLAPRKLGRKGRPWWLSGVEAEVHRVPLGHVLVIGPANFPLFLPGVQTLQALAAGNTVTWKPGSGGGAVAALVAEALGEAGLPNGVLTVTDESVAAAQAGLAALPDKVIFTGSSESGRSVLDALAETATPAVVELSGVDAVIVMPSADVARVAKAVAFGLRLNGGAVCMSPRRLIATRETMATLRPLLHDEIAKIAAVSLDAVTSTKLRSLLTDAEGRGAVVHGEFSPEAQQPLLVDHATAEMSIARSDVFAPVLAMMEVASMLDVSECYARCPYALTVSIFCGARDEKKAIELCQSLRAGTVLINDVIAPTADPRVPFGGRGASGYGVTRGAEGLLEMTAVKTVLIRRGGSMRHLEATGDEDVAMFAGMIRVLHGGNLLERWAGLRTLAKSKRH